MTGRPAAPEPALKTFRLLAGTTLIDLPFDPPRPSKVNVATMWPDPAMTERWTSQLWEAGPSGRGWVPAALDLGDVVGFVALPRPAEADHPAGRGRHRSRAVEQPETPAEPIYWHGYLHAVTPSTLTLRGPYPSADDAYAAAQLALLDAVHAEKPQRGAIDARAGPRDVPVEPAQWPAAVSVTWTGDTATVGDPIHGWIHAEAPLLAAALAHRPSELEEFLAGRVVLRGGEPPVTLAALAATHVPDQLGDITAPVPPASPRLDPPSPEAPSTDPPSPDPAPTPRVEPAPEVDPP